MLHYKHQTTYMKHINAKLPRLLLSVILTAALLAGLAACASDKAGPEPQPSTGQIYLFGEIHGVEAIYTEELQQWQTLYNEQGLRHLFVELPYYTAEFLNLWMQAPADDDTILETLYEDWQGTATYDSTVRDFYRQIKASCPETIFHGTDVGHQRETTGQRFLEYLQANGQENSEAWQLAQDCIEQGQTFYSVDLGDMAYREEMMVKNFIREFDKLADADIMGIYGGAHTWIDYENDGSINMATQLQARYGEALHSQDLTYLAGADVEPERIDTLTVAGREYQAAYFGEQDLTNLFPEYRCRRIWRLEEAGPDFAAYPTNGDILPYNNYPMLIEVGNIYLVEYETTNGEIIKLYYRADGNTWQGMPATEGIEVE